MTTPPRSGILAAPLPGFSERGARVTKKRSKPCGTSAAVSERTPIRVFLVGAVSLHRETLADLLNREPRIQVAGAARDVPNGIVDVRKLGPEVVLLDGAGEERVAAIAALVAAIPEVRVIAFGVSESEREIIECAEAGVAGLVPRDASVPDLVATIERVAAGETLCSPRIAAILLRRLAALAAQRHGDPEAQLTGREREILGLIDEGLSNKQIARRLYIEVPTVKNHVHNILEKLHVHRRYEAAARVRTLRDGSFAAYAEAVED